MSKRSRNDSSDDEPSGRGRQRASGCLWPLEALEPLFSATVDWQKTFDKQMGSDEAMYGAVASDLCAANKDWVFTWQQCKNKVQNTKAAAKKWYTRTATRLSHPGGPDRTGDPDDGVQPSPPTQEQWDEAVVQCNKADIRAYDQHFKNHPTWGRNAGMQARENEEPALQPQDDNRADALFVAAAAAGTATGTAADADAVFEDVDDDDGGWESDASSPAKARAAARGAAPTALQGRSAGAAAAGPSHQPALITSPSCSRSRGGLAAATPAAAAPSAAAASRSKEAAASGSKGPGPSTRPSDSYDLTAKRLQLKKNAISQHEKLMEGLTSQLGSVTELMERREETQRQSAEDDRECLKTLFAPLAGIIAAASIPGVVATPLAPPAPTPVRPPTAAADTTLARDVQGLKEDVKSLKDMMVMFLQQQQQQQQQVGAPPPQQQQQQGDEQQ